MSTKDDNIRIEELFVELNQCREDERNAQNQILQVISVAGTVLGILFGASYFSKNQTRNIVVFSNIGKHSTGYIAKFCNLINNNITYARIMFWFSLIIFCTAFAYVMVLGVNNLLRYYYIQKLEDRLHELISHTTDDKKEGPLLHWNAYIAPIITRNFHHITSSHTALVYFCYTVAVCGVTMFSAVMVSLLYIEITNKTIFDKAVVSIFVAIMLLIILIFLRTSIRAKETAQFAWDTALENQRKRMAGNRNLYEKSSLVRQRLRYLFYPKIQDMQKPLLIVIGFAYGSFYLNIAFSLMYLLRLLFVLFIFDFLAYQARYQINDIRGIKEDEEAGSKNRLPLGDDPKHEIEMSFTIALLKIILCIVITVLWGGGVRNILLVSLLLLFITTIIYEFFRTKEWEKCIFYAVGTGYPLRFFVGFFSVVPFGTAITDWISIICLCIALYAYGIFSSILSWVDEIAKRIQNNKDFLTSYQKKHFEYLQTLIKDRYIKAKAHPVMDSVLPLREKGRLCDPWNMALLFSLLCLFISACLEKAFVVIILMEFAALLLFILSIYMRGRIKLVPMVFSWLLIGAKMTWNIFYGAFSIWYLLLSLLQILVMVTYFLLSYQPQLKKINYKELLQFLRQKTLKGIFGEYALYLMSSQANSNEK